MKNITSLLHTEYILWFLAGCLVSARFLLFAIQYPSDIYDIFNKYYFEVLSGLVVMLFPFVFHQTFGQYPLQAIREKKKGPKILVQGDSNIIHIPEEKDEQGSYHQIEGGIGLLTQLVINAEELSNKIYKRSGVYLIFGVLIAFCGILYFSFQSITIEKSPELTVLLLSLLPRFGILFFIEFIAFFFLKQYRAAMDEFRHYDSIKRNRESQLALYLIASRDFKESDFSTVIDKINFFERVGVLSQGETTELLESSKINVNEFNAIKEMIVDLSKSVKQAGKTTTAP